MQSVTSATAVATTARANDITLYASLELSKSKWVVTINNPGSEKFSKHVVEGGDGAGLLELLSRSMAKAEQRYGVQVKAIVIQEAGLDGFWIHRLLLANGIESHVVDAASIAVNRRHRRAKTDAIDGETLLRTLMAWARGERRVCSMVRAPSREDEDRRRLTRERGTLLKERIQHTNRVRGLLSGQGVQDYDPLRRDRFERLEALRTGDGRDLPPMLKEEIRRELDRIALVTTQLAVVERARDALIRMDVGPKEVETMSQTVSPSTSRSYGLARVSRACRSSRAGVYRFLKRAPSPAIARRPGPTGPCPDAELADHIRREIEASDFHGEGYRKLWARLRVAGVRSSPRRVRRVMGENGLLAPHRVGRNQEKTHDGTIVTDKVNEMWGTDMSQTVTLEEGRAYVFVAVEHANSEIIGIHEPRNATTPPLCFSSSKAWALSSPRSSGWNCCFEASATDARWRLTADWRPVPGRAAASNETRASRSRAIAACARR